MAERAAVGVINLECLMNRANILFTSGYRFRGHLDTARLERSFAAIVGCIEKFDHRLHFEAQDNFRWQHAGSYKSRFHTVDSDDIDQAFKDLCRESLSLVDDGKHCPMVLTVIRDRRDPHKFVIAQTSEHTYVDARSSEVIFNYVVDHYNATCAGDEAGQAAAIAAAKKLRTLSAAEMIAILGADGHDREGNANGLAAYPVADVGEYAIPISTVPDCLEKYKQQRFAPVMQFFDVRKLIDRCRAKYPETTQNSIVCAALAKGFYELNCAQKGKSDKHIVSFKMLSDLLTPDQRQEYSGNYIAFVPVSVDGELPIEDMAKSIHDRIREFKTRKIDLTLFSLVEEAVDAALVGTVDDPLSFVVTNWNNYRFLNTPEFLHGCESQRHQSGVNIEPKDTLGAVLVNRPILVINMSPNDELCLSFFPSLRAEAETLAVVEHIGGVVRKA